MNPYLILSLLLLGCQSHSGLERSAYDGTAWATLESNWSSSIRSIPPRAEENNVLINWAASTPFLSAVMKAAQEKQIPVEVALLPFLLSYYNNQANSTPEHQGIWQIKRSNCRTYNLTCNDVYDERLHPLHSTHAVMERLHVLFQHNESWDQTFHAFYLEQKLYNKHAIPKLGTFSEAISKLKYRISYPQSNDDQPDISPEPYFETMRVEKGINIPEIGELSEIDAILWQQLNGFYLQEVTTQQNREILVPANAINMIKFPSHTASKRTFLADKITNLTRKLQYSQQIAGSQMASNHPIMLDQQGSI